MILNFIFMLIKLSFALKQAVYLNWLICIHLKVVMMSCCLRKIVSVLCSVCAVSLLLDVHFVDMLPNCFKSG
jgi:hypothetical protein